MIERDRTDWSDYVAFAEALADASGAVIRPYFRIQGEVTNKASGDGFDPVTAADREAEAAIRALIRHRYPDHGVLGEEHGLKEGVSPFLWVIDPIDGTRAFMTGMPSWGTLIALNDGKRPVIGVMDQPVSGERFVGRPGGAFFNGRPMKTRACSKLADAVLYSTDPDMFSAAHERSAFEAVARRVKLRRFGGDCYAYCLLALGFVDLVIESDLKPYDIQALIPIIKGAGGVVTSWSGEAADQGGAVVAAGDARVHAEALKTLRCARG